MAAVAPEENHEASEKSPTAYKRIIFGLVIVLLFVASAMVVFVVLYAVTKSDNNKNKKGESNSGVPTQPVPDTCASLRQCSRNFSRTPLVIISFDGFRNTYLKQHITPNIQRIFDCGTHTKFMMPSFPSKTFPNHYTIATGLLPAWHGIVDNGFYDPNQPDAIFTQRTFTDGWYLGDPIWNTVQKHGLKSAVYFWPGSESAVDGYRPNIYEHYNSSVPYMQRVDTLLEWLNYTDDTRPTLLQLYLEEPDAEGHRGGPDSPEVQTGMMLMDSVIRNLTERLVAEGIMGCINLILLSDHGMQKIDYSRAVVMDGNVLPDDYRNYSYLFTGVVAHMSIMKNATDPPQPLEMVAPLKCGKGTDYLVYERQQTPLRFHYGGSERVGEIVIQGRAGVYVFSTESEKKINLPWVGNHGFDNRIVNMRTIFAAIGPSVNQGKEIDEFQNIELYNLFADLLSIPPSPNNGTYGVLHSVLKNPPALPETPTTKGDAKCVPEVAFGACNASCQIDGLDSLLTNCDGVFVPTARYENETTNDYECVVQLCDATVHYNRDFNVVQMVETTVSTADWLTAPSTTCEAYVKGLGHSCDQEHADTNFTTISLFINKDRYNMLDQARIKVPKGFESGVWQHLVRRVGEYVNTFGTLSMFSGPIYDVDADSVRDGDNVIKPTATSPSGVFVILFRCQENSTSDPCDCGDPHLCPQPVFLPFALRFADEDFNCLEAEEFLFQNTVRLRDLELATGFHFFANRSIWPVERALELRTQHVQQLWTPNA